MQRPRSTSAENPYASPSAEEVSLSVTWIDGAPRGVTLVDGLVLGLGILAGLLFLFLLRGSDALSVASATDVESLYLVYYYWINSLAQAVAWVILVRAWRYEAIPRAWEWILLLTWVDYWPGQSISIASPMNGYTFYWPGGGWTEIFAVVLQGGWAFLLLIAAVVALTFYFRQKTKLPAIGRVGSLMGLYWLCFSAFLPASGLLVWGMTDLFFKLVEGGPPPEWIPMSLVYIVALPQTVIWGVPFFFGFLASQPHRRWTEWAGLPYFPITFTLGWWFMWNKTNSWDAESLIAPVAYAIGLGLSPLVLRWRRPLIVLFGLSDSPRPLTAPKT